MIVQYDEKVESSAPCAVLSQLSAGETFKKNRNDDMFKMYAVRLHANAEM